MTRDRRQLYIAALNHEVRQRLLRLMIKKTAPVSPAQASRTLSENVSNVAYHMHYLEDAGLVELVGERPSRGSTEHFYAVVEDDLDHPVINAFLGHRGKLDEKGDPLSPALLEMVSDLQAQLQEHGGVVAIEDELVREGLVRPGPKLWVEATRVRLEQSAVAKAAASRSFPILRFVVCDEDHRPKRSFAIERDSAIDLLHHSHSSAGLGGPAPAFEDIALGDGVIRAGAKLLLNMSMVTFDDSPVPSFDTGAGVRFEVADEEERPLYNFTIDWPLAFLVINLAYPELGQRPKGGE